MGVQMCEYANVQMKRKIAVQMGVQMCGYANVQMKRKNCKQLIHTFAYPRISVICTFAYPHICTSIL